MLKNENDILPFARERKVAFIGPNAKIATFCGGRSASLDAYFMTTPLEGIEALATGGVEFSQGAYGFKMLPQLGKDLTANGKRGFALRLFNGIPNSTIRTILEKWHLVKLGHFLPRLCSSKSEPNIVRRSRWRLHCRPDRTYDFGLCVQGTGTPYIDGRLLISNVDN